MKNIAIAAAAKLASLKHAAAEFPRWQHFSRLAPTGMGKLVRYWLAANLAAVFVFLFVFFAGFVANRFGLLLCLSVVSVAKIKTAYREKVGRKP